MFAEVINAGISVGRFEIGIQFLNSLLFGLSLVLVVYFGALAILEESLTIGMLLAFLAYRQSFAARAAGLVTQGIHFRMLGLHLERLSDIVHTKQEPLRDLGVIADRVLNGEIELDDVSFRYAHNEPFIFENISLKIAPGEFVALVGPSGGGKTTLMNVMLGLLKPERGVVKIDGQPLATFGLQSWRAKIGVVMQDDQLLSGTIADNISFF